MKNHKWDNTKSIIQTCLKCGVSRAKLKRKYGSWEYIDKNNIIHSERIECLTALSKGHKN